jgi:hypothetical protein
VSKSARPQRSEDQKHRQCPLPLCQPQAGLARLWCLRDAGLGDVGDASVYGTLRRLYAAGALSTYVVPSDGGPYRKY